MKASELGGRTAAGQEPPARMGDGWAGNNPLVRHCARQFGLICSACRRRRCTALLDSLCVADHGRRSARGFGRRRVRRTARPHCPCCRHAHVQFQCRGAGEQVARWVPAVPYAGCSWWPQCSRLVGFQLGNFTSLLQPRAWPCITVAAAGMVLWVRPSVQPVWALDGSQEESRVLQ